MDESLIGTWRQIVLGDQSWVLFEEGTCIILSNPEDDIRRQAIELLKQWGPVDTGTPSGDFSVINLPEHPGWVVTCHHPDILNYVSPNDVEPAASDLTIGLLGRSKRQKDTEKLKIVHVEE